MLRKELFDSLCYILGLICVYAVNYHFGVSRYDGLWFLIDVKINEAWRSILLDFFLWFAIYIVFALPLNKSYSRIQA
jgi:hypothetical protein